MLPQTIHKHPVRVSSWVKGAVGLLVTAFVDMVVSFSTAFWGTWSSKDGLQQGGYGLWKMWYCAPKDEVDLPGKEWIMVESKVMCVEKLADTTFPGWYVATQVMETLGLAGLVASLILLFLYIFWPRWNRNKTAMSALVAVSYLSGLFILVGLCVFGYFFLFEIPKQSNWTLSWSFSLGCTAFVLNAVAASILVTETKRLYREAEENEKMKNNISQELQRVLTPDMLNCQ